MAKDVQYSDNAEALLTTNVNNSDDPVSFSVTAGAGAKFPALTGNQWYPVVLVDSSGNYEKLKVTARTTDSMTADRAQGGTTKKAFAIGDAVYLAMTKEFMDEFVGNQELQSDVSDWAIAGGTADAITAIFIPTITALVNGQDFNVRAGAANETTTPTFSPDELPARTITKNGGLALAVGDIPGAGYEMILRYDSGNTRYELLNPATVTLTAEQLNIFGRIQNLGLAFSVATNALTAAVKTAAGADASAASPIKAALRHATVTNGTFNVRTLTAALGLVVSSGSTLGHRDAEAGFLYWYLIDNAGTLELAVSNRYFGNYGIVSTTAEGGIGGADSPTVMYSAAVRTNVPFICIGRTTDTQTTAGTWATGPGKVELWPFDNSTLIPLHHGVNSSAFTPEPSMGARQTVINGGAFQWNPPTEIGDFIITVINNASAGNITDGGFDEIIGDIGSLTDTTDGNVFEYCISNSGVETTLQIRASENNT